MVISTGCAIFAQIYLHMKRFLGYLFFALLSCGLDAASRPFGAEDSSEPVLTLVSTFTAGGEEVADPQEEQSAPVVGHFELLIENQGTWEVHVSWRVWRQGEENNPILVRYGNTLDYTFTQDGVFLTQWQATLTQGNDTIILPGEGEAEPVELHIAAPKLEFPNAFSPNGDGYNDVLRAKEGWKSVLDFRAAVFNRWGQKIYEWNDPNGGWDGKQHGRTVPDGVYFLNVRARGADGKDIVVKKTINVLTGNAATENQ